jgi:hypothetical protein
MIDFYIFINNEQAGPFTRENLQEMLDRNEISLETLYAQSGMSTWEPLSTVFVARSECPAIEPLAPDAPKPVVEYNDDEYRALVEAFEKLPTFSEVNSWIGRSQEEVKRIETIANDLEEAIRVDLAELEKVNREFQQQSFLKRTFGNHDSERTIAEKTATHRQLKGQLLQMMARLQGGIESLPGTPEEKKQRIKDLRHQKKELQSRKREETAAMTAIRSQARISSAEAGKTWLGLYDSEQAADERRQIRSSKESALIPHENAKAHVEQQLIAIDRELLRLDNIQ